MLSIADGSLVFQGTSATQSRPVAGPLVALGPNWSAQVGSNDIAAGDLVELIQIGVARPNLPRDRPQLLMTTGDRWPGRVVSIINDQLRFVPAFGAQAELTIPVNQIAVAWLKPPRAGAAPDVQRLDLTNDRRNSDHVYLNNQDLLTGTVARLSGPELRLDQDGKSQTVAVDRISAIGFNTDLAKPIKQPRTSAHVVLGSGTRVTLRDARLQDGRIVGTSIHDHPIRLLLSDVIAISMRSDRVVWLDDLKPSHYEHTPFLSTQYPVAVGKNTKHGPLHLGPHVFDFGIGLHSQSRLTYDIPIGVERFEAWMGLDASVGKQGDVRVTALIDGVAKFGPVEIAGSRPPERINLTIPVGARGLTLVVEFAGNGDVQDHVNWADARFLRPAGMPSAKP